MRNTCLLQLQQSLQQRALKRQSLILSLPEISRKLAAFKGTTIAMPGVSVSAEVRFYYRSFISSIS